MKFILDEKKLTTLLSSKKSNFETSYVEAFGLLLAGFSLGVTQFCSDYEDFHSVTGKTIKSIAIFIAISAILYGISILCKKIAKKYTYSHLRDDIIELAEENNYSYSIIAIQNNNSNKYLLYYDKQWDCRLFLNYKVRSRDEQEEIKNLKVLLSQQLEVPKSSIQLVYKFKKDSFKPSIGNNEKRFYEFNFYYATIKGLNDTLNSINTKNSQFFWMSIPEMEEDTDMMDKNGDVVSYIKNTLIPSFK